MIEQLGQRAGAIISASVLALALGTSVVVSAEAETTTLVARGTVIPVLVTKEIRVGGFGGSETKKVTMEVAQDVVVNHFVIARKGDTVEGHMATANNTTHRIFSNNTSSELSLAVDDIINFCGDTIHMKFERTLVGGGRTGVLSVGAHAHDAVFDKGVVLKASTDRVEKKICSEHSDRGQTDLPPGMMVPDEEVTPAPQ